jgi:hypothetical protein
MGAKVLLADPYNLKPEDSVEFRLVYEGLLLGASNTKNRSDHKHAIRKVFHEQLKVLWEKNSALDQWPSWEMNRRRSMRDRLAEHFKHNNVSYVPLSWDGLGVACRLDILMLRPESPGQTLIRGGDIDNRLKTLFDALRMPKIGEVAEEPDSGANPFYCLLQDDSLINHLSVTTDLLLQDSDPNNVKLVISVNLWPITYNNLNMGVF